MALAHSHPVRIAIVAGSVQSVAGQHAIRSLRHLGIEYTPMIDLRQAFQMPGDEVTTIVAGSRGGPEGVMTMVRTVSRHVDFPPSVSSSITELVEGPRHGGLQLFFIVDEHGGFADVVARSAVDILQNKLVDERGELVPAFGVRYFPLNPTVQPNLIRPQLQDLAQWLTNATNVDGVSSTLLWSSYKEYLRVRRDHGQPQMSDDEVNSWNMTSEECGRNQDRIDRVEADRTLSIEALIEARPSENEPQRIRHFDHRISPTAIETVNVVVEPAEIWRRNGRLRADENAAWYRRVVTEGYDHLYQEAPTMMVQHTTVDARTPGVTESVEMIMPITTVGGPYVAPQSPGGPPPVAKAFRRAGHRPDQPTAIGADGHHPDPAQVILPNTEPIRSSQAADDVSQPVVIGGGRKYY